MKTLTISLKRQWFDMIKSGEKKEEYRDNSEYWQRRLYRSMDANDAEFKQFDRLVFTLGYPKSGDKERRLVFNNPKIRIGHGRLEWGAEPGKQYFVITFGDRVK